MNRVNAIRKDKNSRIAAAASVRHHVEAHRRSRKICTTEHQAERDGLMYAQRVTDHIKAHSGQLYPQSTEGHPLILMGDKAISLNFDRDNPQLAALFLATCGVTHLSLAARMAIARLQADALEAA